MTAPFQKIGSMTAMWLVIACMIGTGVFTSLGFQVVDIKNTYSIILLWVIGGVLGLIGAFSYAELGTHFKESGGDYVFLSRIFHPFAGYLYAWTSLCVGFSAPIAIAAMAMIGYMSPIYPDIFNQWFGIAMIILLTLMHSISIKKSGQLQDITTVIKFIFVLLLIAIGFYIAPSESNALLYDSSWREEITLPAFAVSLIYVTYAYTGWNSAAYIVDEIENPVRNLPRALIGGTIIVTVLYVLIQLVLLRHASVDQLAGQVEVVNVAFGNILDAKWAIWISVFIGVQLIATISGYLWIGSRIIYAMADEHPLWTKLVYKNKLGVPTRALWIQAIIAIGLTLTGTFEQIMLYASFVLQLMGTLTVASLLWVKRKEGTFKSPWRPFLQIVFILFSIWVLGFMLIEQPYESMLGLGIVVVGAITYFIRPSNGDLVMK